MADVRPLLDGLLRRDFRSEGVSTTSKSLPTTRRRLSSPSLGGVLMLVAGAIIRLMRAGVVTLAVVAGFCAGCGGGNASDHTGQGPTGPGSRSASTRTAEGAIRAWADTLRSGDVRGAAEFFSLPSVVSNGTPPIVLRTKAEVRGFNASLPCGARLLRTYSAGRYTTAVFRLTERPGPGKCGDGVGRTARTTFVVRDGKIRQWRRVPDSPEPSRPVV